MQTTRKPIARFTIRSMADLLLVPPESVAEYWDYLGPRLIRPAFDNSTTDYEMVGRDVKSGAMLMWIALDKTDILATCVTQICEANGEKFCMIVAIGGHDMSAWFGLLPQLEEYASKENCKRMVLIGRKGWQRQLGSDYRLDRVTLSKELQ